MSGFRVPQGIHRLQVAPMIDVTDRDFRFFVRLLTKRTQLWTEMITSSAVNHTDDLGKLLGFSPEEHPIVCQIGGNDPGQLAAATSVVCHFGFDEVNLNVGCPSGRVANSGGFGAELIKKPNVVKEALTAMTAIAARSSIPVSMKTRLGVDDLDSYEYINDFLRVTACPRVVMHCRKAWLLGLSPAENRTIPKLNYGMARIICGGFPNMKWWLNGGVNSVNYVKDIIETGPSNLEGVMIGRGIISNPMQLWDVDRSLYNEDENPVTALTRGAVLEAYSDYLHDRYDCEEGVSSGCLHTSLRPVWGILHGCPGQKRFRNVLDSLCKTMKSSTPAEVLKMALQEAEVGDDLLNCKNDEVVHAPFVETQDDPALESRREKCGLEMQRKLERINARKELRPVEKIFEDVDEKLLTLFD